MSARLLDKEYRHYLRMCDVYGSIKMSYVEFRRERLLKGRLPDERVDAFKAEQKQMREARTEREFLRKQAGLPPIRMSRLEKSLIQRTKEHDDV